MSVTATVLLGPNMLRPREVFAEVEDSGLGVIDRMVRGLSVSSGLQGF